MLSSRVVAGPQDADGPVVAGSTVHWTLANDGLVPWPLGATLRLVGGPVLLCPVVEVPPIAPGETVELELEVQAMEEPAEVFYCLVTQECQPFGEIVQVRLAPQPQAGPQPACALLAAPAEGGLEALQGEVKNVEWMLANIGHVPWPEDVSATLIYNTPGFDHLPGSIKIPSVEPGMTVHAGVSVLMPEKEGNWKALWAVMSPSHPEFGETLVVEFHVSEFPFMEWMLADGVQADSVSEAPSQDTDHTEPKQTLSMRVAMQQHIGLAVGDVVYAEGADEDGITSLGQVSCLAPGQPWLLQLALHNDGTEAWPLDAALTCCFGSGMGCSRCPLSGSAVEAGETILIQMELCAPEVPSQTAWVMATGQDCFGPALMMEVQ